MHELLNELRAPIAFAIIAFCTWLLQRITKGLINDHTEILRKEVSELAKTTAVMQAELKAAWRHIDRINSEHEDEEEEN